MHHSIPLAQDVPMTRFTDLLRVYTVHCSTETWKLSMSWQRKIAQILVTNPYFRISGGQVQADERRYPTLSMAKPSY